jgi:hypothetical protein
MQSADSSLGLSWWLFYQMPGKLQGFRTFRTTWLRLEPDYLLATAYVEFIYTLRRQIAQAFWLLSVKDQRLHRRQCSPIYAAQYIRLSSRAQRGTCFSDYATFSSSNASASAMLITFTGPS